MAMVINHFPSLMSLKLSKYYMGYHSNNYKHFKLFSHLHTSSQPISHWAIFHIQPTCKPVQIHRISLTIKITIYMTKNLEQTYNIILLLFTTLYGEAGVL